MSSGQNHYAGLFGSKQIFVGNDGAKYNYTSISDAVSAAQNGDVITIEPGTYSLSETLTINKPITIIGRGRVVVNGGTTGIADRLIMVNVPASFSAAVYMHIENIQFANANATADVVEVDNDGGAAQDLYLTFKDCSFDAGASGVAFDVDQTTATKDIFMTVAADLSKTMDSCNFALTKAGSTINIIGYDLSGGAVFALGTTDVASKYQFQNCLFGSNAITTGGAASIIENVIGCGNIATGALAALTLTDFDATGDENILTGSILV